MFFMVVEECPVNQDLDVPDLSTAEGRLPQDRPRPALRPDSGFATPPVPVNNSNWLLSCSSLSSNIRLGLFAKITLTVGLPMKRKVLMVFSGTLVVLAALATYGSMQVRATPSEQAQTLPGDGLIPQSIGSVNHAVTIRRPPHDVWPWLVQMGSGRAGWYAYDFIDNGGHRSADRILPEFQNIEAGSVFPALPGVTDVFTVVQYEPEHSLVLSWRSPSGRYLTTWAFVLQRLQPNSTRLIVRGRVAPDYHPYGLPQWIALLLARPAHFIMERKQLFGIARRAESLP